VREADGHDLLLTRRSASLRRQPNDISFPGGAIDARDVSALEAALRESEEEVGLRPGDVELLGQLDERATVTGFHLTPFVGAVAGPYSFRLNHEVAELILAPLSRLREPEALRIETRLLSSGRRGPAYRFQYGQHDIWGITGRLIYELLALLPDSPTPS
jgi:8-oxo-dGTP pyrophosphatase MutT (NUDIX family)